MQLAIMVKLPEVFGAKEARRLGQELKGRISKGTPSVLVDLSRVRQIDLAGIEGLLDCMEAVARKDGSLQLGEISAEAAAILELTGMDRLFHKFPALDVAEAFTAEEELAIESQDAIAEKIAQTEPVAA